MKWILHIAFVSGILCCIAILASGQGNIQHSKALFSETLTSDGVSHASEVLGHAENRMRIVKLPASFEENGIDLSGQLVLNLFDNAVYTVTLTRQTESYLSGLEVWKGRVVDSRFDHLPHYLNAVVVVNRKTNKLVANIETQDGFFQVLPTSVAGEYRIRDCKPFDNGLCGVSEQQHVHHRSGVGSRSSCNSACDETDASGRYVLDVFAGYSNEAAALAGDLNAHAQANIETVNTGLTNSLVVSSYLRLVGTGTSPNNPGIIPSALDDAWTWFADEIEELAPDFVAVFQTPTNAPNSAGGWGYVPGRASVNGVEWGTVFRHEFGHNVGGSHCFPDDSSYKNGHNNGHWRTHLCGNDENFYSTPLINDDQGNPIGDVNKADMVRAFEETAAQMATYAMHRVPFDINDACSGQICFPGHWGNPIEYISRVQFNTIDNQQANPGWNCESITGFSDYTDIATDVLRDTIYAITVTSNFSWEESTLDVWIDWNANGLFSAQEQVVALSANGPWTSNITVPTDAVEGPLRMRIRLLYGLEQQNGPCNESWYSSGETEDYTVNVIADAVTGIGSSIAQENGVIFHAFPNPASDVVMLHVDGPWDGPAEIMLLNAHGQFVLSKPAVIGQRDQQYSLDLGNLPAGLYICTLRQGSNTLSALRFVKL